MFYNWLLLILIKKIKRSNIVFHFSLILKQKEKYFSNSAKSTKPLSEPLSVARGQKEKPSYNEHNHHINDFKQHKGEFYVTF